MSRKTVVTSLVMVSATGLLSVSLAEAGPDVSVGVAVGVPAPPPPVIVAPPVVVVPAPPPPVVIARPQIVVVPGSPVYYAPRVDFNLFVYGGRHYRFHEGHWFVATSYGGPWTFVPSARVPHPVLAVPVTYYRIPPGHAKKMAGPGLDAHGPRGKNGKHNWAIDDPRAFSSDVGRRRVRAAAHWLRAEDREGTHVIAEHDGVAISPGRVALRPGALRTASRQNADARQEPLRDPHFDLTARQGLQRQNAAVS